jgi:hypothetical protein
MWRPQTSAALLAVIVSATISAAVADGQASFASGTRQVALVELYTSEGCSSCPPADRWFTGLKEDAGLWTDFVPVAFHVDYWDYIGWKDRFARPEYSARQRRYAAEGGARVVYTPGMMLNGREWTGWRVGGIANDDRPRAGRLRVRVDDREVIADFDAATPRQQALTVYVAVLGMGLTSQVGAGENSGKTLHHDFVVLGMTSAPLERGSDGYHAVAELPATGTPAARQALVAWVSATGSNAAIQAVGGYLPQQP